MVIPHIPQFDANFFGISRIAREGMILCMKYMYCPIMVASLTKFCFDFASPHVFYSVTKRVKDAIDTNQKSAVRNCGRWVFLFSTPLHATVIASLTPLSACFYLVAYLVGVGLRAKPLAMRSSCGSALRSKSHCHPDWAGCSSPVTNRPLLISV